MLRTRKTYLCSYRAYLQCNVYTTLRLGLRYRVGIKYRVLGKLEKTGSPSRHGGGGQGRLYENMIFKMRPNMVEPKRKSVLGSWNWLCEGPGTEQEGSTLERIASKWGRGGEGGKAGPRKLPRAIWTSSWEWGRAFEECSVVKDTITFAFYYWYFKNRFFFFLLLK